MLKTLQLLAVYLKISHFIGPSVLYSYLLCFRANAHCINSILHECLSRKRLVYICNTILIIWISGIHLYSPVFTCVVGLHVRLKCLIMPTLIHGQTPLQIVYKIVTKHHGKNISDHGRPIYCSLPITCCT